MNPRPCPRSNAAALAFLIAASALPGCNAPGPAPSPAPAPAPPRIVTTPAEIGDPCANRLHDLEGYLTLYVAARHQLPPTLEALGPLAGAKAVSLACPASGRPYVYQPQGLTAQGDHRVLVLYDATPAHDGKRQAIMLTPAKGNQAPFFEVIMVTDTILKAFGAPNIP